MNYLASIASKALGQQQPHLLFSIGSLISESNSNSIWAIHTGVKKDDQQKVTVFIFDMKRNPSKIPLARNALKRSKTIRFPDCLKFVDGIETESQIIIGTEQVETLQSILFNELDLKLVCLGIYKITKTLKFIAEDCRMVHGFICPSSIFVTRSGEWKVGGFECLSALEEDQFMLKLYGHLLPSTRFIAPELEGSSKNLSPAIDAWSLGCLIWNIFNGTLSNTSLLENRGKIPSSLFRYSKSLCTANPGSRMDFEKFLKMASASKGYFDDPFIASCMFLEQFALKDKAEKDEFLLNVENTVGTFPIQFCKYKILPELLQSLEFGGAGSKALKPILTIGGRFGKEDFNELVTPSIIKLFNSNDRSIRLALCEKIESYVEHLSPQACNDTIFPNLASGFLDTTAIIREQTLKAVIVLAPKLSSKTINNVLLRHLAKLQVDPEPGIRTNTTICLAKLSIYFDESVKAKVLLQAFLRSLKDPFPFARKAGLMGISASASSFTADDFSKRILPHISPLLMDPYKTIRDQAFLSMDSGLKLIKQTSNSMPDQPLTAPDGTSNKTETTKDGWTSWAASAMTNAASASLSAAAHRVTASPSITPRESTSSQGSSSSKVASVEVLNGKPSFQRDSSSIALSKNKVFPPPSAKLQIPVTTATKVANPTAAEGWGWDDDPEIPVSPAKVSVSAKNPQPLQTFGWENDEWDKDQPQSPHTDAKKGWDEDW